MEPSFFTFPVHDGITKISRVAYMQDLGTDMRIIVNHHHLFEYNKEDSFSKVAAIVTLLKTGAANQTEIADAFDINRDTARRYLYNVEKYGYAGLFMAKTGPQGAHKITPKVHKFIVNQLDENKGVASILESVKTEFDLELSRKSIERIRKSLSQTDSSPAISAIQEELSLTEDKEQSFDETPTEESPLIKDAISSDDVLEAGPPKECPAGLFFLWPFLHILKFQDIVSSIFNPIRAQLFFVRETLLTILIMVFLRCKSVEDYKMLEKRHIGLFWEGSRGMNLRTLRRKLNNVSFQKNTLDFLSALAYRYQEIGFVELGVLYFDGHFIPYYGEKNLHKGFFTQRRLAVPGQHQYFLNDTRGRPIFFWLKEANKTMLKMFPDVIQQIKDLSGQDTFTIVFDRGGFSSKLFAGLNHLNITFMTYLRGVKQTVDPSAFHPYTLQYRYREQEAELTELGYIEMEPEHYRLVVRKKGQKQTFILTNDWQRNIDSIATLMFNRWSQENFFKYMVREYHMSSIFSYLSEETSETIMVNNPDRTANRQQKKQLEQELQQLEHFLAEKMTVIQDRKLHKKTIQKIQSTQERVDEIQKSIKQLNLQHKAMPLKVPASQLGDKRSREILYQEKKMLADSLKLLAYNAEEWLLDILSKKYNDYRDFRRVLLVIMKQPGTIERIADRIVIRLHSLHNPRFQRTAEHLAEEINQMKIPAPSGEGTLYFEVATESKVRDN